jgi:hypothetical protein
MGSLIGFVAGFATGWAARSIGESPHDVGVKLIEVAQKTKDRVEKWAAVEYERVTDMFAEAQARAAQNAQDSSKGLHAVK